MNETIENITNIILEYNEIEIDKTNGFYLN